MEIKKFGTQAQAQVQSEEVKMEGGVVKPNVLPEVIEKMINDRI